MRQLWMWRRSWLMMNFITMTFWLYCWETGSTQRPVSRPPGPHSMTGYDVIIRTQIRLPTPSRTYVVSATHRAHRSFVRNSLWGASQILNLKSICGWSSEPKRTGSYKLWFLRVARILSVSTLPRTLIDQLSRPLLSRKIASRRTCSSWWIDLSGPARAAPISAVPPSLQQMCDIPWYTSFRGNVLLLTSVLMSLSRMWRDRLSREHRVRCSRVPSRLSLRIVLQQDGCKKLV